MTGRGRGRVKKRPIVGDLSETCPESDDESIFNPRRGGRNRKKTIKTSGISAEPFIPVLKKPIRRGKLQDKKLQDKSIDEGEASDFVITPV